MQELKNLARITFFSKKKKSTESRIDGMLANRGANVSFITNSAIIECSQK